MLIDNTFHLADLSRSYCIVHSSDVITKLVQVIAVFCYTFNKLLSTFYASILSVYHLTCNSLFLAQ